MKLTQRILITAFAFAVGIALMPLAPVPHGVAVLWQTDDDGEDNQ